MPYIFVLLSASRWPYFILRVQHHDFTPFFLIVSCSVLFTRSWFLFVDPGAPNVVHLYFQLLSVAHAFTLSPFSRILHA
jgi:hypothetical protein